MTRLILLIAGLLSACTHHHHRAPTARELKKPSTVRLKDGRRVREARGVRVESDARGPGTIIIPYASPQHRIAELNEVSSIEIRRRGAGLVWGALAGAGVGTLATLAMVYGDEDFQNRNDISPGTVALAGLALGAGLGAILGYEIGIRDIYHLEGRRGAHIIAAPTGDGGQIGALVRW